MDAKTCDRCGVISYDSPKCKINITEIKVSIEKNYTDYDLCDDCKRQLFDCLKPINIFSPENKAMRIFK